jgi:hypothetical protein
LANKRASKEKKKSHSKNNPRKPIQTLEDFTVDEHFSISLDLDQPHDFLEREGGREETE